MQGLMMDMPLLISGLIQYAADYHGEAEIVATLREYLGVPVASH